MGFWAYILNSLSPAAADEVRFIRIRSLTSYSKVYGSGSATGLGKDGRMSNHGAAPE